jgi:hypothetical protein
MRMLLHSTTSLISSALSQLSIVSIKRFGILSARFRDVVIVEGPQVQTAVTVPIIRPGGRRVIPQSIGERPKGKRSRPMGFCARDPGQTSGL